MADYKELIADLRNPNKVFNDVFLCEESKSVESVAAYKAAGAIEQLVSDYEILAKMYAKVNEDLCVITKERDAAVADLSMYGRYCVTCVGTHDMCDTCLFENNWKWRGVQEDNDEID